MDKPLSLLALSNDAISAFAIMSIGFGAPLAGYLSHLKIRGTRGHLWRAVPVASYYLVLVNRVLVHGTFFWSILPYILGGFVLGLAIIAIPSTDLRSK